MDPVLKPKIQSPTNLVLAIFTIDPLFSVTVLNKAEVIAGDWCFIFAILSESHLVQVKHRDSVILQETLMCSNLTSDKIVHTHHFHDRLAHRYTRPGYAINVSFGLQSHWIPSHSDEMGIEAEFPEVYDQVPTTHIAWSLVNGVAKWRTQHLYPDEYQTQSVESQSEFRFID